MPVCLNENVLPIGTAQKAAEEPRGVRIGRAAENAARCRDQRPNLVLPEQVYSGKSCAGCPYLNLAAFAPQPLGTVGNLGWNSIVGPRFWGLDMALSRNFQTREKQSLQIRVDAFNVTNSFVPFVPSTANPISNAVPAFVNVSNNMFGQILAAQPTRKLQFALKYAF